MENIDTVLQAVVKEAKAVRGVKCGIRQVLKSLENHEALMCVLAENCDNADMVKLVESLCAEHSIQLLKVESNKKLGELAGLCKFDAEMNPRKVVSCSSMVITNVPAGCVMWESLTSYVRSQ